MALAARRLLVVTGRVTGVCLDGEGWLVGLRFIARMNCAVLIAADAVVVV